MTMEKVSLMIEIGKLVWDPIKRHGSYLFYYRRNVNTFIRKVNRLEQRQIEVQQDVNQACQRGEVICDRVQQWLASTENMMFEAERMEANLANTECFRNPFLCYRLGKEAEEKISHVDQLENEANFARVAYPSSNPNVESLLPNRGFQASESTEEAMKLILDALKDDETNIIGVHGMGGVGKTMLTREVAKQVERDKLFDRVVMVTVSQKAMIDKIQKEIGEMVGFKFEDDSIPLRAAKLLARLKQEKKLLVILDDLWEKLELSDVGIPYGDEHKGCKIIITSRSSNLYMIESQGSQTKRPKIDVQPWPEKESRNLFKRKAGDVVNSEELSEKAINIVRECKGLPLAIVVLGLALRDKSDPDVWDAVLERLKNAIPEGIQGMEKEVFQSIKYSYDHLESEETKLCFLLCCLFPEDMEISRVNITRLMVGERSIEITQTLDAAEKQVSLLFDNLKASGLLLEGDRESLIKMHDIVRDVAIWIALKENDFYSRPSAAMKEWPRDIKAESCKRISLQHNEITELPHKPSFPNLHTLLLNHNENLEMIPGGFFSEMKALTVLDLSRTKIRSLPSSVWSLMNLRVLLLHECIQLEDLSGIGALKSLEVLDLCWAAKTVLPTELGKLSNLRSLNLFITKCMIPSGVISQLTRLEELYVAGSFEEWQPEGSEDKSHAAFAELACLSRLRRLYVCIKDERCFHQDLGHGCFQELKTFKILGSYVFPLLDSDAATLMIVASVVPDWAKLLAGRADYLILYQCPGVESLDGGLDISITTAFSNIKHLQVFKMKDLCRFCQMAPPHGFLANLKTLRVWGCDKLTNIFSCDRISRAHQLKSLKVIGCKQLCNVFQYDSALGGESHDPILLPHLRSVDLQQLPQLTSIWEGGAPSLGNLTKLSITRCDSLKYVFTWGQIRSLALLEELSICYCSGMVAVIMSDEANSEAQVTENNSNLLPRLKELQLKGLEIASFDEEGVSLFDWPSLESIEIHDCPNLKKLPLSSQGAPPDGFLAGLEQLIVERCSKLTNIFSSDLISRAHQLEVLKVSECNQLCHMFQYDSALGGESHDPILLPHLTKLKLYHLPQLTSIWEGGAPSLGNLRYLKIDACYGLKYAVTWGQIRSLALLEKLYILNCPAMVAVIMSDEVNSEAQVTENNSNLLPRLRHLRLEGLKIASFDEEGVSLFDWQSLEDISIQDCPNLKKLPLSSQGAPRLHRIHGSKEWFEALEWEDENIKSRLQSLFSSIDPEDTQESINSASTSDSDTNCSTKGQSTDEE